MRIKFLVLFILLFGLFIFGQHIKLDTQKLEGFVNGKYLALNCIIFVVLYVSVTFFVWLSKDIFKIIGAVLFGAYLSTLLIFSAELINACILFGLARSMGRDFVLRYLFRNKDPSSQNNILAMSFPWILLLRVTPLVPFRFLDLFAGLSKISFKKYIFAVILGSPLRIFWMQFILAGIGISFFKNPDVLMQYLMANKPVLLLSFVYIVLVGVVALRLNKKGIG